MLEILQFLNSESNVLQNLVFIFTIIGVLITLVTVILTMINLRAVVKQVKEMQLQRNHSQEPDLFIEPINLSVNYQNEDILFTSPWRNNAGDLFNKTNSLPIKITNIGNGVAKHVTLNLFFEKDYLNELVDLDIKNTFNLRTLQTDYGMEFFQYEFGDSKRQASRNHDMDSKDNHFFNYIRKDESVSFLLNTRNQEIFNIAMIINSINSESTSIPRIKASVSYYDSFNTRYEKDIDIFVGSNIVKHVNMQRSYDFSINFELSALNRLPEKIHNKGNSKKIKNIFSSK